MNEQIALFDTPVLLPPTTPGGFSYHENFISTAEETDLLAIFKTLPFKNDTFNGYTARRRITGFGWRKEGDEQRRPALPAFIKTLTARAEALLNLQPNSLTTALISEYSPGTPIGWHRDKPLALPDKIFCVCGQQNGAAQRPDCVLDDEAMLETSLGGENQTGRRLAEPPAGHSKHCKILSGRAYGHVVGISFNSPCQFRLRKVDYNKPTLQWERFTVQADPRSLYCMADESRTHWQHSIPAVEALRYSITLRDF